MLQLHADNRIKASYERTVPLGLVVYHFLDDLEVFLAKSTVESYQMILIRKIRWSCHTLTLTGEKYNLQNFPL